MSCSHFSKQRGPAALDDSSVNLPAGVGHLTFQDEFDSGLPDNAFWNRSYVQMGVINDELEYYAPDAFEAGDGVVRLKAERRSMNGFNYTSGAMTTFGKFAQTYGYFEMRAKLPKGNGFWPAFWLLPINLEWPPEIDILEQLGQDPKTAYLTYHWKDANGNHQKDSSTSEGENYTADFHIYALEWRPGLLVWYVDGIERKRLTKHVPNVPMYILANLAVGGSWPKPPDATTPFPSYMDIDYIRAYQFDDVETPPMPAWWIGPATANVYKVAAGEKVKFSLGLEVTQPQAGFILQVMLKDHAEKLVLGQENFFTADKVKPGSLRHEFSLRIPKETPPGVYHLNLGVFRKNWSMEQWVGNAVVIQVE